MMKENLNRMLKNKWLLLMAFVMISIGAFAQEITVKGIVTSREDGMAIPGVSVMVKGTTNGTITDMDGNYSIKAPKGATLVFSFIGMESKEVVANETKLDVALRPDVVSLDEVVAIGYGTQKKKEVTGAVVQVKSEELEKISTSDLGSALQGSIAGVSVQASSGAPGSSANIQIRGVSSINGQNDPLWVVDGIPQSGDPGLSSSEIATMDVLKDAASCAIYGTRGAAGVILVTTKKGKAGEMKISANGYYGVQKITSGIDLLDFEEYFQTHFYNKVHLDPTTNSDKIWTSLQNGVDNFTHNTSIVDVIENDNAKIQNYSVNVSGGKKDLTYNVVGSFFEQEGSLINTNYERFNVRANTSYKKGKWTVRTSLGFKVDEQKYAAWNLLYEAYKYKPYQAPLDPNANTFDDGGQENDKLQLGTVMAKLKQTDTRNGESFNGNVDVNLELIKGLNLTTRVGVVYGNNTRSVINPVFEVYDEEGELVINSNTRSGIKNTSDRNTSFTWEGGLNYNKKFGQHQIKFLANTSVEEFAFTSFWASGKDLTSNEVPNIGQTTADYAVGIGNDWTQDKTNKLVGVLGRVQYNYKDGRYNVSVSARRDGSSRFGEDYRWKTFPSASASWNVADESFFQGLTGTINAMKIRASYGTTGNQSILDYSYAATISSGYDYANGVEETTSLALGSIQTGYANPNVQWETSIQKNLGFDFGFFSNKLTLNVDLYDTEKKDLLFPLLVPTAAGAGQNADVILNVGDMSNKGVEIAAGYRHHGKFSWGASATYTKNINEVTKMAGSNEISYFANGSPINVSGNDDKITVIKEGLEAGAFMVMETDGIINTSQKLAEYQKIKSSAKMGDLIYVDQNGDNTIDESDRVYGGSGTPEYEIGFNFNCDYKGFDFSMKWFGSFGQEIINGSRMYSFTTGTHKDLLYQWHQDNPYGVIPSNRGGSHDNYRAWADIWIEDGSYVRLRNVMLGYTIPKRHLSRIGVSKLRFYVAADNPLTFTKYTGYDPEVGNDGLATRGLDKGNYPISSQYRAGVQLDF